MVNDALGPVCDEDDTEALMGSSASLEIDEADYQEDFHTHHDSLENFKYKKLMEDAIRPLYPSCRFEGWKLSVTVELLNMKARHQWPTKSFTALL